MSNKHQLALPAALGSVTAFQSFIDQACAAAGLDDEASYDIKLAVDEVCVNIIEHGYRGMDPGTIIVSFQYGVQQIVVRITDFGQPFEPSEPPEPDHGAVLDGSSSGYGIYFIYRSVDSVSYETTESGNTLTLIKRLKPN